MNRQPEENYFSPIPASNACTSATAFFTLTKGRMISPMTKKKIRERIAGRRLPSTWFIIPKRNGPIQDVPRSLMEIYGPSLEQHRLFPDRVNVGFATVREPGKIDLVVWERGCGFTQACGSGACAAATAAIWEGLCDADTPVEVHLPGGTLHVRLDPDENVLWLTGPARLVFKGTLDTDAL